MSFRNKHTYVSQIFFCVIFLFACPASFAQKSFFIKDKAAIFWLDLVFGNKKWIIIEKPFIRNGQRCIRTDAGDIEVDKKINVLSSIFFPGASTTVKSPIVSKNIAEVNARNFAQKLGVDIENWILQSSHVTILRPDFENNNHPVTYEFAFIRKIDHLELPSKLNISIESSTGKVHSLFITDDKIKIPLRWKISLEKAFFIAQTKSRFKNKHYWKNNLYVTMLSEKEELGQRVAWNICTSQIPVRDEQSMRAGLYSICIDALTGKIVSTGQSGIDNSTARGPLRQPSIKIDPGFISPSRIPKTFGERMRERMQAAGVRLLNSR